MKPGLDYEDAKRWFAALVEKFPEAALQAAVPAMTQALLILHGKIPEYPEASADSVAPDGWSFASDKQRRYFFWAVRNGQMAGWTWIDGHPEKTGSARSGTLGRRWTEQVEQEKDQVIGEIGTNVAYAPWVVGPDYPGETFGGTMKHQAKVHAGTWWQFVPVMRANEAEAWQEFSDVFWPVLVREIQEV